MGAPALRGGAVWGRPLGILGLILLGPLLLLGTPLARVGAAWAGLLLLAGWTLLALAVVGALAGAATPVPGWLEERLRQWVAWFAPDPAGLWLHWARTAHRPETRHRYLGRAARLGGAEALFQEGLAFLEGGFGPGGAQAGVARLRQAAERGHAEAAFRLAEALRTGLAGAPDRTAAEDWYQRSARAGFGPAAAWLAHAYAEGDGVAAHPDRARRWAGAAARLAPHPPLSRSLLRPAADPDEEPEDPLVGWSRRAGHLAEGAAARLVAHRPGRWILVALALLLGAGALAAVGLIFWTGSSGLHHLPLLMLAPSLLLLAWQARQLRREGPSRGRDRLREAAEGGDPEACFRLGMAYRRGAPDLPKDDLGAVMWFRRAAEAGHPGAREALAQAYLGGHGVLRDPREAARWSEPVQ